MVGLATTPSNRSFSESSPCSLGPRLFETRTLSTELAGPLSAEDMTVQAMDDASPTKWHLAHTTWFFETFVLAPYLSGYQLFDEAFNYCFNSYYECQGTRQPRPKRGLLTRPSLDRIFAYREHVDRALTKLLAQQTASPPGWTHPLEVGINHEQQHQELMLTDILALFAANPLRPAYRAAKPRSIPARLDPVRWIDFPGGVHQIGHEGNDFAWDNERPRHDALVAPFRLADRLITNAEWLEFVADGGYETATLWLSDGWAAVNRENWRAPLYWEPARRRVVRDVARRIAAARPRCAGGARELLRSRRFRAMGGKTIADRIRMGGRGDRNTQNRKFPCDGRLAPSAGRCRAK